MSNFEAAVLFFVQIALILGACQIVGRVARWLGQPQVVAEMITGVILGPSLFGWLAPTLQQYLFPWDLSQSTRDTQSYLFPASQLGLALYMFVVGMEFRTDVIRNNFKTSASVSLAGIFVPFVLGASVAAFLHQFTDLFGANVNRGEAMLFLGASLCITAFPMLARIIHFKGLAGTVMGTVAIGAGALDDAIAWGLLAVVLASFDNEYGRALISIGGGLGFALTAAFVIRPLLLRFQDWWLDERGELSDSGLVVGLILMALGAWTTDVLDLHAVFGAFIMGSVIPRGVVQRGMIERIQPLTVALLLPLFFTYSGLNTRIGLLNTGTLWLITALILVVSVLGKGVACAAAAKFTGLSNREAWGIGALMNSRGLMELIIINIGLQRGIISPELFAILVIMAIITTLMASPIFEWVVGAEPKANVPQISLAPQEKT